MNDAIICSGYFNPLHVGHLDYLQAAAQLGSRLWVIVNNDKQVSLKGSHPFIDEADRQRIVAALGVVDQAILSIDEDLSVCKTLSLCVEDAKLDSYTEFVFANGGDRTADEIPEASICDELGIEMVFGVGGKKITASSELIENAGIIRFLDWLDSMSIVHVRGLEAGVADE